MNMTLLVGIWGAMACVVIALAIYRKVVATNEDDMVHLRDSEAQLVNQQTAVARRLDGIDVWGKRLTILVALLGVAIACYFLYGQWVASTQLQR